MDRFSERCSRESIKSIMVNQEEIFKQQVHELHRLYQVQKILMTELSREKVKMNSFAAASNRQIVRDAINKLQNSTTSSETTHSSSHASIRKNANAVLKSEHASAHQSAATAAGGASPELINGSKPLRKAMEYILQNPVEEGSPESCSHEEDNLDLTLRIGCASDWKEMTNREEGGKECTNSSNGFGAESLKRPHWIFQALSLNRT